MFRKPSKKKKATKIRKRQEKDDDDDQEDVSLQDKIRSTQKKQKILSSIPLVTGDPSRMKSKKGTSEDTNSSENATGEMSVLAKKHYMAMQEYIEEELNKNNNNNTKGTAGPNSNDGNCATTNKEAGAADEETLYQELAKEVYSQRQLESEQAREERGAVLVGGTGMAEVVLPSSHNNDNNSRGQQSKNRVYRRDASSSSAFPASSNRTKATLKSAVPQFRSFRQDKRTASAAQIGGWGSSQMPLDEIKVAESSKVESSTSDGDRAGFNAYRGKPTKKKPIVKKQRDDLVFSDFVKYQRTKMTNGR